MWPTCYDDDVVVVGSQGSCTMKLNSATEMLPCSFPQFTDVHPFAPVEQARGYRVLLDELEADLCEITGFDRVSFQSNRWFTQFGSLTRGWVIRRIDFQLLFELHRWRSSSALYERHLGVLTNS